MKFAIIFACLAVIAAAACKPKPKEQEQTADAATQQETFDEFFAKFKTDSVFQTSRIKFPLHVWAYEEDPNSPIGLGDSLIIIDTLTPANYHFLSYSENTRQQYDNYKVEAHIEDSVAEVFLSGVDNGILVNSVFEKIDGKWYLTKIEDEST